MTELEAASLELIVDILAASQPQADGTPSDDAWANAQIVLDWLAEQGEEANPQAAAAMSLGAARRDGEVWETLDSTGELRQYRRQGGVTFRLATKGARPQAADDHYTLATLGYDAALTPEWIAALMSAHAARKLVAASVAQHIRSGRPHAEAIAMAVPLEEARQRLQQLALASPKTILDVMDTDAPVWQALGYMTAMTFDTGTRRTGRRRGQCRCSTARAWTLAYRLSGWFQPGRPGMFPCSTHSPGRNPSLASCPRSTRTPASGSSGAGRCPTSRRPTLISTFLLRIMQTVTLTPEQDMQFFLGTHHPHWLRQIDIPLFISAIRLRARCQRKIPVAKAGWALDSGGFSELILHGEWTVTPLTYALEAQSWQRQTGKLQWAAIQDWMCEPQILAKTGLTVRQHQARTTSNYRDLLALAPDVPWVPVLQGWEFEDYLEHIELYRCAGYDLAKLPLVGLGSVCRRQDTQMAEELIRYLHGQGLKLHGFGFKLKGLARVSSYLASADSMAWSYHYRRRPPLPGHSHKNCANCQVAALRWYDQVIKTIDRAERSVQRLLF